MARLNKKRCAVIAGAMLIAAVLAADYAGLFFRVINCGFGVTGFSFKCLDKETGSPVAGVQLACVFEGEEIPSAPWAKGTPAPASVGGFLTHIHVGGEGSTNDGTIKGIFTHGGGSLETLFFTLRDGTAEARKKSIEFVFSQPSYHEERRTYVVGDLGEDTVVELAPIERMTGE